MTCRPPAEGPSSIRGGRPQDRRPWGGRLTRATGWALRLILWLLLSVPPETEGASDRPADFPEHATTISQSGQFVVSGPRSASRRPTLTLRGAGDNQRDMTPQTLAVSCDRLKVAVLQVLGLPDLWRLGGGRTGKIFVSIDPTIRTNTPLAVEATPFEKGWQFRVGVPPSVTEDRLVRALTQALTMEIASRRGNERSGNPPLWLVEGITQAVFANAPDGIILQPETRAMLNFRLGERLIEVRTRLGRGGVVPFHELSQPDLAKMGARQWEAYSACAHLCFRELSRLPDGQARMARWLQGLQQHWNWQTGFLEAYHPIFQSLLDVEKWWSLTVANFAGRTPLQTLPRAFALRKLEEALQPVGILPGAGNRASRIQLEEVVASWDFGRQVAVLNQVQRQLQAIQVSAPPEVNQLVFKYFDAIEDYLAARRQAGFSPSTRGRPMASLRLITREFIGRLRVLDGERGQIPLEVEAPPREPAPANAAAGESR